VTTMRGTTSKLKRELVPGWAASVSLFLEVCLPPLELEGTGMAGRLR
jgi:hypothetical protein